MYVHIMIVFPFFFQVLDFTNDPKGVLCILDDLVETVETEIFDMSSLFDSM